MFYVLHLYLILVCVEDNTLDDPALPWARKHIVADDNQDVDLDDEPDYFDYDRNYHPRSSWMGHIHVPQLVASMFRIVGSTAVGLFVVPPEDETLVTRDLTTAVRQLRFWAGIGV